MREDGINVAAAEDHLDANAQQQTLVTLLKEGGCLADSRIEAAFRAVPRHLFLPDVALELVYADEAIPTKWQDGQVISSSSQPTMMAIMLEQLALQPGNRVLEIGAGTGYNAALMAHIVGAEGHVVTVDIDEDVVVAARAHLAAAGASTVRVVHGDGAQGFADAAPYDRIILTVGAWDIAPAWLEQLRPSGRLLLPLAVGGSTQKVVAFERAGDHLASVSVRDAVFVPLRGTLAPQVAWGALFPEPGLVLGLSQARTIDAERVYAALLGQRVDRPVSLRAQVQRSYGEASVCGWRRASRRRVPSGRWATGLRRTLSPPSSAPPRRSGTRSGSWRGQPSVCSPALTTRLRPRMRGQSAASARMGSSPGACWGS